MENDNHIFAQPPPEIAKALGWKTTEDSEASEEKAALELFSRTTTVSNPWLAKPGENGVIEFGDDDAREAREYAAAIEPVAKLFTPKETVSNVHSYSRPLPVEQDEDEKQYFRALAPLEKLFHPDAFTTVTPTAPSNQFTKRATAQASFTGAAPAKKTRTLTYKKLTIGENVWCEGTDENGEVMSMMLVLDETDE